MIAGSSASRLQSLSGAAAERGRLGWLLWVTEASAPAGHPAKGPRCTAIAQGSHADSCIG